MLDGRCYPPCNALQSTNAVDYYIWRKLAPRIPHEACATFTTTEITGIEMDQLDNSKHHGLIPDNPIVAPARRSRRCCALEKVRHIPIHLHHERLLVAINPFSYGKRFLPLFFRLYSTW